MKGNFRMNWKGSSKYFDTDVENLGKVDYGEEFLTITMKVRIIRVSKRVNNAQLTRMRSEFRLL